MDQHADVEEVVRLRYSAGARAPEPALCCPTSYAFHRLLTLTNMPINRFAAALAPEGTRRT
jgi:hypothetical protein